MVVIDEYEDVIDTIEEMIEDDNKFPVVEDGRIKMILKMIFEFIKVIINCLLNNNASKKESQ